MVSTVLVSSVKACLLNVGRACNDLYEVILQFANLLNISLTEEYCSVSPIGRQR